jgi:hypothetical protein
MGDPKTVANEEDHRLGAIRGAIGHARSTGGEDGSDDREESAG